MAKLDFKEIEEKWKKFWEEEGIYKFDPESDKTIYSIDTPPPTVSGRLHMGHVLGDAQQDFFARYKRMQGFNVLSPFGTDNNGLPTLKLVEKEKNVNSKDMKREDFIELCNKTIKEEFIPMFIKDIKDLGASTDFDIFYSTIDERSRRLSQWSFIDLYKKGREYRQESPALWCPVCQTTMAQFELEDEEKGASFNHIKFKAENEEITIATTRPELLCACVALFVNPEDSKNKHLMGKKAKVPLYNFEVPIIADKNADPEKGSGIVMCCTFGDQTDMEWQKSYNLPIKVAISKDGKMTSLSGKYEGKKVNEAREKIIEDLKSEGFLKDQEQITHSVNVHDRCGNEIEFITAKQWFVKYLDLKEKMYEWGKQVKWYPEHMKQRYEDWVKGLKWDWCISRQIPFGIPFPVWYCSSCEKEILAEEKDLPVDPIEQNPPVEKCPECGNTDFKPEKDVMNTWATSALTPTILKDIIKETSAYKKLEYKPLNIRRNGQDIITFWDFNSIIKSQLHYGINPWKELYINGWILGRDGKKMSKSKGNGVAPQEVIKNHGADALRYLAADVKPGGAVAFSDKELKMANKLYNKLYNASKFVFMNLEDYNGEKPEKLEKTDSLFLKKLNESIEKITKSFEEYQPSRAREEFNEFFWHSFCDNYLEIVKKRIYNETGNKKISAQYTLYNSLLTLVKMLAPIMPFITEEVYQTFFKNSESEKSVHLSKWPEKSEFAEEINGEKWEKLLELIGKVRQTKTESQKSMKSEIKLNIPEEDLNELEDFSEDLKAVTNAIELKKGEFNIEFVE